MPKYMSQASKKDRYKASRDYLKLKTQQSRLPSIDKSRYQPRKGLEGPFITKHGHVIYYDKKFGQYYNPDTDMYIDHDDWKKMSEEAPAKITEVSDIVQYWKDIEKIKTQQHKLPPINKAKYSRRGGLEGPFMTKAGQVVYYDKQQGQYYNPDNDMYISYDDWKKLGEEAPANATGTAVAGTGDDSSTVVVKKKKKLQDKLMTRLKIKEALDRAVPDLEYPKDEITERKQQLIDLAKKYGENI